MFKVLFICTLSSINSMKAVYELLDIPRAFFNFVLLITGAKPVLGPNSMIPYIKKVSREMSTIISNQVR